VLAQPHFPSQERMLVDVDFDVDVDLRHLRPGDAVARLIAHAEAAVQREGETLAPTAEAPRQDRRTAFDVGDARRPPLAEHDHQAVDFAELVLLRVDDMLVEDLGDEMPGVRRRHHEPPMISSGMATSATIAARKIVTTTTVLPMIPLRCLPTNCSSFRRMRNGRMSSGRKSATNAIEKRVSFSGSTPARIGMML